MKIVWEKRIGPEKLKRVYPEYYDAAARIEHPLPFPSPVNDTQWLRRTVEWFTGGRTGMEVGPGRGEFAEAVLRSSGCLEKYYIVDMSQKMLDVVRERLRRIETNVETVFIHADVDEDSSLEQVPPGQIDRLIMINVFQDISAPRFALTTFRRLLDRSGELRINVSDREEREKRLRRQRRFFDKNKGLFFITRRPDSDAKGNVLPLGYLLDEKGERTAFYRVQKAYYSSELRELMEDSGFRVVSEDKIFLPKEVWLRSVATDGGKRVDPEMMNLLDRRGGYLAGIEVTVRPIPTINQNKKKGKKHV